MFDYRDKLHNNVLTNTEHKFRGIFAPDGKRALQAVVCRDCETQLTPFITIEQWMHCKGADQPCATGAS